ncbi:MAG: PKD domain-containing protein [Bacteroidota bacterium]
MNLKMLTLCVAICCLALLPNSLFSQCNPSSNPDIEIVYGTLLSALPIGATTIPRSDEDLIIEGVNNVALCRTSTVQVFLIPSNNATYTFPCEFELHLDELGENDIILDNLGTDNLNDGWSIVSGQNTAHPILQFNGSFTNAIYILTLRIEPSCDLFDLITSGENAEIENNQISLSGCYDNGGGNTCIEGISESFNLEYNLVTLQEGNSVTTVDLGEEFTMTKNMEVSGDVCVNDFQTYITVPPSFDLSNLEVKISLQITVGQIAQLLPDQIVPAEDVTITDNLICIRIDNDYGNLNYRYCNTFFPGGMGEISLTLCNLEVEECPAGGVEWRTNSCILRQALECAEPDSPCYPQSESICYVNVPNGDPQLTLNVSGDDNLGLNFCEEESNPITFSFFNSSSDNAYDVSLKITAWEWMSINMEFILIQTVVAGQLVEVPMDWISDDVISSTGPDNVTINFANQTIPLGNADINGDGFFGELAPNQGYLITVSMSSSCPFNTDPSMIACQNTFPNTTTVWRGNACWNNQCKTNPESTSRSGTTRMDGDPSNPVVECPGDLDIEPGEQFTFDFCVGEWDPLPDFDEDFFDLGPMTNILQVNANSALGTTPTCVTYDGTDYFPTEVEAGVFEFDLGVAGLPPASGDGRECMELKFDFDCPSIPFDGPVNLSVILFGEWECSDPMDNCRMSIGCGGVEFYPQCPCEPTEPDCEACDFMATTDFNALRPTAPPGGNFCGAYVCDPIDMTITGTVAAGYSGPIGGYFTMELFANGLDLVSDLSVTALLNGTTPLAVGPISNDGGQIRCYRFQTESVTVTTNSTIEFFISGIADKEGIESMNPYTYTINRFIGGLAEVSGTGFQKCTESDVSTVFQLYRVEPFIKELNQPNASCNRGINFNFGFGYRGGTIGDEFPNEDRPINELTNGMSVTLSGAPGLQLISATGVITETGVTTTIDLNGTNMQTIPVAALWPNYSPPDKTLFEDFTQTLRIRASGDCNIPSSTVAIEFDFDFDHNVFSSECKMEMDSTFEQSAFFQNGTIVTTPSNPNIVTYTGNSIDGSSDNLEICFNAVTYDSDITWAQFTYPDGALDIEFMGSLGTTCEDDGSGMTTQWFPIPEGIDQVGNCLEFGYRVLSCDETEIVLNYAIGKACYNASYDEDNNGSINGDELDVILEDVACESTCLVEGAFNIEIEPSGLIATIEQCTMAENPCDEITFALVVENPGGGITSDISLDVDLPSSMELVSATYEAPYGVSGNPCNANPEDDIIDADNGPVIFLDQLEGVQTASSDAQRRAVIHVTVRFTECPNVDLPANTLSFTIAGQRNCGEEISFQFDQYEDLVNSYFLDFSADMQPNPDIKRDCSNGVNTGVILLEILDWMPENATLPPGQTITLELTDFGNIDFNVPNPFIINYGQELVEIPYTFTGELCDRATVIARLRSRSDVNCEGEECFNELIDFLVFTVTGADGNLSLTNVEIGDGVCEKDEAVVLTTISSSSNILNGNNILLEIFCDDGTGNPTGPPIFTTTHTINLTGSGTSFEEVISTTVPADDILNTCNGQIVVMISTQDACICFLEDKGVAEACCEFCPEVSLRAECKGGNTWVFTVMPDVPNLAVNYSFPGGVPSGAFTIENPYSVTFTTLPSEVCASIFSDFATNCDTLKLGEGGEIAVGSLEELKKLQEKEILTACDTLICMPLDECYADGSFTCEQNFNGKFWTLDVEGIVSSNLNTFQIGWTINGAFQSVSGPSAQLIFTQPGVYEVCMVVNGQFFPNCKNEEACKIKICKKVIISDNTLDCVALADFSYTIGPEGEIIFKNSSTYQGDRVEYTWNFGDRNTSTDANPKHRYQRLGRYEVTLTVTVYSGKEICEDKITIIVDYSLGGKGLPRSGEDGADAAQLGAFQSTIFPNPAWESVNFTWRGDRQQSGTIEVFNISGQRVFRADMKADAEGNNSIDIPVDQWGPGMYLLRFEGEHDRATHRFIVE